MMQEQKLGRLFSQSKFSHENTLLLRLLAIFSCGPGLQLLHAACLSFRCWSCHLQGSFCPTYISLSSFSDTIHSGCHILKTMTMIMSTVMERPLNPPRLMTLGTGGGEGDTVTDQGLTQSGGQGPGLVTLTPEGGPLLPHSLPISLVNPGTVAMGLG